MTLAWRIHGLSNGEITLVFKLRRLGESVSCDDSPGPRAAAAQEETEQVVVKMVKMVKDCQDGQRLST